MQTRKLIAYSASALGAAGCLAALLAACAVDPTSDGSGPSASTSASDLKAVARAPLYHFAGRTYRRVCEDARLDHPVCGSYLETDEDGNVLSTVSPATINWSTTLGAADLASAYDIPTYENPNATVAIVIPDDDPTAESDLAVYRSFFGLPACTTANGCFKKVSQTGSTTSLPSQDATGSDQVETTIDLDMASAACPNCKILLVEATPGPTSNMMTAVDEAVTLGASVVSMSWSLYGNLNDAGVLVSYENSAEAQNDSHFNHPTVGFFAGSGDLGFNVVAYPGASPYVTAVGGTVRARAPREIRRPRRSHPSESATLVQSPKDLVRSRRSPRGPALVPIQGKIT